MREVLYMACRPGSVFPAGYLTSGVEGRCPMGWIEPNGASLSRAEYPELFAVIGTKYGAADDDHFNLPDMKDALKQQNQNRGNYRTDPKRTSMSSKS